MSKRKKLSVFVSLCVVLIVCAIFFSSHCSNCQVDGAYEGMSLNEFNKLFPEDQYFSYLGYIFCKNQDGSDVVATVSDDYMSISSLRCFRGSAVPPNRLAACKILPGMNVHDVVRVLGTPQGTATSGMITLYFELNDGSICVVYFNNDRQMLVTSVQFRVP